MKYWLDAWVNDNSGKFYDDFRQKIHDNGNCKVIYAAHNIGTHNLISRRPVLNDMRLYMIYQWSEWLEHLKPNMRLKTTASRCLQILFINAVEPGIVINTVRCVMLLHAVRHTQAEPGPRLNIKTVLSTYGDFHVKDKTAVRTSYL